MFPASTKNGGQCMMTAPDVCKTPSPGGPIPIPYPNMASLSPTSGESTKVKISGNPAMIMNSEASISSGDEAGSAGGGVVSNKIKGAAQYKVCSTKVNIENKGAATVTAVTGQNGGSNANTPGMHSVPSQVKVLIMK